MHLKLYSLNLFFFIIILFDLKTLMGKATLVIALFIIYVIAFFLMPIYVQCSFCGYLSFYRTFLEIALLLLLSTTFYHYVGENHIHSCRICKLIPFNTHPKKLTTEKFIREQLLSYI